MNNTMLPLIVYKAENFAVYHHEDTNHKYDGKDYYTHLKMVFDYALEYSFLLDEEIKDNVLAAAWCHDLIEDCRLTYNDIKESLNTDIAEIVFALTNEKGKTRKDRASEKYYTEMTKVKGAVFTKICDRLANAKYSKENSSRMFKLYQTENDGFNMNLFCDDYEIMFQELYDILHEIK